MLSLFNNKPTTPHATNNNNIENQQQQQHAIEDPQISSSSINKIRLQYIGKVFKMIIISILAFITFDPLMNVVINFQLQLKPDGLITWAWLLLLILFYLFYDNNNHNNRKDPPIPINSCWYIWGIANTPQFLNGDKPLMMEHGPFCYL